MPTKETVAVMGHKIYALPLETIDYQSNKRIVNTLNSSCFVIAQKDHKYHQALHLSDILLPDGFPVVWAVRLLTGRRIQKIAGNDVFHHNMCLLNERQGRCFFLGSTEATLERMIKQAQERYPNVSVGSLSPPFKTAFSDKDNQTMIEQVNRFQADVLFVGLTAPKQEKWVAEVHEKLNVRQICSVGAVFNFFAGDVKRAGDFWLKLNLEWFIRLVKEPRRMWRRYLVHGPLFFFYLLLYLLKIKK